jgi:signal transduction histidine kinase
MLPSGRLGAVWTRVWRSGTYLLVSLASGIATVFALPLLCVPRLTRLWADWHRVRAARLLAAPAEPRAAGASTGRDLLWLPVNAAAGIGLGLPALLCAGNIVTGAVVATLWWAFEPVDRPRPFVDVPVTGWAAALTLGTAQVLLLTAAARWCLPPMARAHARITLVVLSRSPAEQLAERVETLTRTRADVLDAHGAELRRIERDLHDGTQARLVAIAMRLAVARQALTDDPRDEQFLADLLREAHEGTEEAMTELRGVIRTVYPPILADRGLTGALTAVTARCAVPTRLRVDDVGRVPAAVEAVVYFAVAEALTNVVKHSRATAAEVRLSRTGDRLAVTITDDGAGGAAEGLGTGLAGIRGRVLALDGDAGVDSPPGGPTTITLELPCGS